MPARVRRVLESALYVENLDRAVTFYRDVMGLTVMVEARPRLFALDAGQGTVLLLFLRGSTASGFQMAEGNLPPHDGQGPSHAAFAIEASDLADWEARLAHHGVPIESRVHWGRGGTSLYFRDPDGHSIELATRGTWPTY